MKVFTEKEAEKFLSDKGFKIVKTCFAKSKKDLVSISKTIKFPWAMKVNSKKIIHKKRSGGVILDIKNLKEAENAFHELYELEGFESAIIQPMLIGKELIIGIKRTPEFGQVIMIGKGGSDVEKEKDVSFRVIPLKKEDALLMLKELQFYPALKQSRVKFKEIEKTLLKISRLATTYPNIAELDINPLMINAKSAQVVDARVVFG